MKEVSKPLVRKTDNKFMYEDNIPPYFKTATEIKKIASQVRRVVVLKKRDYQNSRGYTEVKGVIVEASTNTLYIASRDTGEIKGIPWWAIHDAEVIHEDTSL